MIDVVKIRDLIYALFLLVSVVSCKRDLKPVQGGSFSYAGKGYSISAIKLEHQAYTTDDRFVMRLLAYPGTYKVSETKTSGYGAVLDLYFLADDDLISGEYVVDSVVTDTLRSQLIQYPKDGMGDTVYVQVASGSFSVDTVDNFPKYNIALVSDKGDSIVGSYWGKVITNNLVDKWSYGTLEFDTINCDLSRAVVWAWDSLMSPSTSYYEMVIYSTDARYTDAGKMRSGVHFVLGFLLDKDTPLSVAAYPVVTDYTATPSMLYGHKLGNVQWGSYWQVYKSGSVAGKANIISGELMVRKVDDGYIDFNFNMTDQLNNSVTGSYAGSFVLRDPYNKVD